VPACLVRLAKFIHSLFPRVGYRKIRRHNGLRMVRLKTRASSPTRGSSSPGELGCKCISTEALRPGGQSSPLRWTHPKDVPPEKKKKKNLHPFAILPGLNSRLYRQALVDLRRTASEFCVTKSFAKPPDFPCREQ